MHDYLEVSLVDSGVYSWVNLARIAAQEPSPVSVCYVSLIIVGAYTQVSG